MILTVAMLRVFTKNDNVAFRVDGISMVHEDVSVQYSTPIS